jgi:hypothetical protein
MQRSGLIQVLRQRNAPRQLDKKDTNFNSVSVYEITPVLFVMANGILMSVLVLITEHTAVFKKQKTQ